MNAKIKVRNFLHHHQQQFLSNSHIQRHVSSFRPPQQILNNCQNRLDEDRLLQTGNGHPSAGSCHFRTRSGLNYTIGSCVQQLLVFKFQTFFYFQKSTSFGGQHQMNNLFFIMPPDHKLHKILAHIGLLAALHQGFQILH